MTVSNMMTLGRFCCVPVVFICARHELWLICLAAYVVGLATDAIDGRLARLTDTATTFGRAMDSAADKALVAAVMLGLTAGGRLSIWLPFLFVAREFAVFGLRAIRTNDGSTVAEISDRFGRLRFAVLHIGIIALLLPVHRNWLADGGNDMIILATALSYIALVYYVVRDRQALSATMRKAEHDQGLRYCNPERLDRV